MDARQRKEITDEFFNYRRLTQTQLWDQYSAYEHWAKIEVGPSYASPFDLFYKFKEQLSWNLLFHITD